MNRPIAISAAQVVAEKRGDSPLVNINGFVADEGMPMQMSLRDLSTHLLIFGKTSSGMTSNLTNPRSHS